MKEIFFSHQGPPVRLDLALRNNNLDLSRNFLCKLLENGKVCVNDKIITKNSYKIYDADQVSLQIPPEPEIKSSEIELEIIDEEEDFIIINKPAGMLTHPAGTAPGAASVACAIRKKIQFPDEFMNSNRSGIVHRLDRETSGLLIIAKNPRAHNVFAAIFQQHKITKKYLAITCGKAKKKTLVIQHPIGRNPKDPTKFKCWGIAAKEAKTVATLLKQTEKHAILDVQIMTGRTHQIRVHLANQGLPILGDSRYGKPSDLISRQALHAYYLKFCYRGQNFEYQIQPPEDFHIEL